MITSKQRRYLKGLAHGISPRVFIGKNGFTKSVKDEIDACLEAHELVKVKIQEGCELKPQETASHLVDELGAEFVQAIGRKFTLYRKSKNNPQIEIPKN